MLFTLKDDNITGSFIYGIYSKLFSMIMTSDYIRTRVHLYKNVLCTDGLVMHMHLCLLLVAICVVYHWPGICYYQYVSI